MDTLIESSTSLGRLFGQMSERPSLYFDNNWRIEVAVAIASMKHAGEQLQDESNVPEDAREVQEILSAVGREIVAIMDEYLAALDTLDAERMNAASQRATEVTRLMTEAQGALQRLRARYAE